MSISFGSINTGLPKDIVKQIIEAEKIPIHRMENQKANVEEKKKLIKELIDLTQSIKKHLNNNSNYLSLSELKIEANDELVGVSVDKNTANPGNYQFEVIQLAQRSSALSSGFENPDESYIGVGFIRYNLPNGETRETYIDSDNSNLNGIAKLLNADSQNGIRANVINDGSDTKNPWRLLISLKDSGENFSADFPYFYFVDGERDFFLEKEKEAQNAIIKIDGFEIEAPENKIKGIIPGVTIDLKKAKPDNTFDIKITQDNEAVSVKIDNIFDDINKVLEFIKKQNDIDENTNTAKTLGGDLILQTIESRLRNTIFKNIETSFGYKRIGDIGVNFQRDGTLKIDKKKFDSALAENWQMVSEILVGRVNSNGVKIKGFIGNFKDTINTLLIFPNGPLINRDRGLQSKIDQIDQRIENRQRIIDQKEQTLKDKFARLEGIISKIKTQGAGLAALTSTSPPTAPIPQS